MVEAAILERIGTLVGGISAAPSFPAPPIASEADDPLDGFNKALKLSRVALANWRSVVLATIFKLEEILKEARGRSDDVSMRKLVNESAKIMLKMIDDAVRASDAHFEGDAASQPEIVAPKGNALQRKRVRYVGRKWQEARADRSAVFREMADRAKRVLWDFDPDARGGPKFDNAKDLLVFLKS